MGDRTGDLFAAGAAGRIDRRELIRAAGRLGLGAAAASALYGRAASRALAADFDWRARKGEAIRLALVAHPYADAMTADLDAFRALTGIEVVSDVFPEDVYFDRIDAALASGAPTYDAFMTGAYQTWRYGPAGWIEDLRLYLAERTHPAYAWDDVLPVLRVSTAWSGVPGAPLGTGDARQWCLPWGYETNAVSYNRRMFGALRLDPPRDLDALREAGVRARADGGATYGLGLRGSRSWATIHAGFLSAYSNFGERDFTVADGKLRPAMNTPGSKRFHAAWVRLVREAGSRTWPTANWYQVESDFAAGASAAIYDADILGYFAEGGRGSQAGSIGFHAFAPNPAAPGPTPNLWVWSLALPAASRHKEAAWLWMLWATSVEHDLFGAREMDLVNPVRASVARDPAWRARIEASYPGYLAELEASLPGARIHFTPQPLFAEFATAWAGALQEMVAGEVPVDEGLDRLAESLDGRLREAGLG